MGGGITTEKKKAIIIKTLLFPKPSEPETTSNYLLLVSQISFMCLISLLNQIYLPINMREITQKIKQRSSHQTKENGELLQSSMKGWSLDGISMQLYFNTLEASKTV